MQISELAQQASVSVHALRHYERLGLIRPDRRANGYGDYPARMRREVVFIAMSRQLGFSLPQIALRLDEYRAGLRLAAGQQARRRQCAQPAQGLVSCVIDVHRSLIIVVIVGGEIRGNDPGQLAWIHLVDSDKQLACHTKNSHRIKHLRKTN